ncbi:unnamed protein product [Eruca vesicaria subsp. sativa]|uniref:Uncharacterized protein n=1 Tax=Eruca vesicaria subsp. sativa TaxID=29727 RepID=A0ABC8KKJ2_ERUVS|nr:unnamed protein product [Eruca vesicaria subsp. sativa]
MRKDTLANGADQELAVETKETQIGEKAKNQGAKKKPLNSKPSMAGSSKLRTASDLPSTRKCGVAKRGIKLGDNPKPPESKGPATLKNGQKKT